MGRDATKEKIEELAKTDRVAAYKNEMNVLDLSELSVVEARVFFLFVSKLWGGGTSVAVPFDEIRSAAGVAKHGDDAISEASRAVGQKLARVTYSRMGEGFTSVGSLFSLVTVRDALREVEVELNPHFVELLSGAAGLTIFNVEDFGTLKSRYSQGLFVVLKQWRSVGRTPPIPVENASAVFRRRGPTDTKTLVQKVVPTAVVECGRFFPGLRSHYVRGTSRGNPVEAVWFSFSPDESCSHQESFGEWARIHTEAGKYENKQTTGGSDQ